MESFRRALPDFVAADVVGSPYCIRDYTVAAELGGPEGLASARRELERRGLKLILDFVPNHVAPDHAWTSANPEYFVCGSEQDLEQDPASFIKVGDRVLANGRDPYFPAWPDVVQLNAFSSDLRAAVIETLGSIADQCDGVRCDMAMLMMNDVFERTWGGRAGTRPADEYWPTVIEAVKARHPDFVFIAEAYWDMEYALQQQGFSYCYDKRLYDRLVHEGADSVHGHLTADTGYQDRLVRFIENHDEPRAAATFPPGKARAAAVATLGQTGARLVHEGQLEGRRVQLPVFLARRPDEEPDADLRAFYERLLGRPAGRTSSVPATGSSASAAAGTGNDTWQNLVVLGLARRRPAQARRREPRRRARLGARLAAWDDLRGRDWRLDDTASGDVVRAQRRRPPRRAVRRARPVGLEPLRSDATALNRKD